MAPLKPDDVKRLEIFIKLYCDKVSIIFYQLTRSLENLLHGYILMKLGGRYSRSYHPPAGESSPEEVKEEEFPKMEEATSVESEESEVELDNTGVIEPETVDPPELGDSAKVVSDDDEIAASVKRGEAVSAFAEGDLDKAVDLYTEAIKLNPGSAMLYAKRASVLLKQNRVTAALRDCDEAIKLNPDSASAYKFRGRSHRLLGNWLEAAKDLRLACRLDFDDDANDWLREVQPNATKLEEHQRKYGRKKLDKEIKEKQERIKRAREEHKKAQEKENTKSNPFGGGMPGGMPGNDEVPDFGSLFNDEELVAAMQDPEVAAAFQDVSTNPANIFKYQSNPKVAAVINKITKQFGMGGGGMPGGMGGMPGGFPGMGGFPGGMGGMPGGFPNAPPPSSSASDDLD
ncbi:Hsc70-interacting protein [Armadillidium vulgare]|nr:Hsc70-interacting protein [Armadillidium vulgare]